MTSLKCPHCGLVNFGSATECKRCQASLDKKFVPEQPQRPTVSDYFQPAAHQNDSQLHRQYVTGVQYKIETESGKSSRIIPAMGVMTLLFALSFFVKTMIFTKKVDLAIRNNVVSGQTITGAGLEPQGTAENSSRQITDNRGQETVKTVPTIKIPPMPNSDPSLAPVPVYKSTSEPADAAKESTKTQPAPSAGSEGVYQMFSAPDSSNAQPAPSANQSRTPMAVSGGVLNGKAVTLVKPLYPAAARAVRAAGTVNVEVSLDVDGNVVYAAAVSGHPLLKQSAESAARASKFNPTIFSGEKVKVAGIIVYNFTPSQLTSP